MVNFAVFDEFKNLKNTDQITRLEIYLTWHKNKQYYKIEFKDFLHETDKVIDEIARQAEEFFNE